MELEEEIEDRFGTLPEPVRNLLCVARIKAFARKLGVSSVSVERESVVLKLHTGLKLPREVANHLLRRYRGRLMILPARANIAKLRVRGLTDAQLLAFIEEVLNETHLAWHVAPAARQVALAHNR